ncbi:MAG: DnaA regulatory inactivator Hda [Gammaproteobacteria bacterium]|nr:DnaA regulatory inactivator Hda [Gammaproteobacteria bacterium]
MPANPPSQLTLGVTLDDNATFENFLIAESNQQAVACLSDPAQQQQLVAIWGSHDAGLTHLLQAACHQQALEQRNALYLPMHDKANLHPEILEGANTLSLVCLDNVELIAGDAAWEAALFTAFNAIKDSDTQLLLAMNTAPAALPIQLPDLRSRLQSCLVFQIGALNDHEKLQALQLRAKNRGMELNDAVAEYILQRADRSSRALMQILDQLDATSLSQRRRLTIPLVKSTLGW